MAPSKTERQPDIAPERAAGRLSKALSELMR
jgi:hypothetical protein